MAMYIFEFEYCNEKLKELASGLKAQLVVACFFIFSVKVYRMKVETEVIRLFYFITYSREISSKIFSLMICIALISRKKFFIKQYAAEYGKVEKTQFGKTRNSVQQKLFSSNQFTVKFFGGKTLI